MIVDSQVHLWEAETPGQPWPPGMAARAHLKEPLTYQSMLPAMDEAGVDRVIIVPPTWQGDRNDHALEAARYYPDRFAVMGRIALDQPDARELLPDWKAQTGMLGLRVAFNHERAPWIINGAADWLWPLAEEFDIPIMIFAPETPEQIGRIAFEHRKLRLIIDHMGLSTQIAKDRAAADRIATIARLAKYGNIAVKLSAVPVFSNDPYPFSDMTPFLRRLIEAYGPQRCFWGTDFSHAYGQYDYREFVTQFQEETGFLSDADRALIMGDGIRAYLGWE